MPTAAGRRWRRRVQRAGVAAAVAVAVFAAVTARLFVFPAQGLPAHVDALVMLDGPGDSARLAVALRLAREHRAPVLLISQGTWQSQPGQHCEPAMPGVRVICFNPAPGTTRGEAEFIGRFARQHHWTSLALVTAAPQDTRARLRVGRCFPGQVYAVTAPLPASQWPYEIAYEWGATVKALFLQRNC